MNQKEFYRQLIRRYVTNQATEAEVEAFFALMASSEMDDELQEYLHEEAIKYEIVIQSHRYWWSRIAISASIFITLFTGYYFIKSKLHKQLVAQHDVQPFTGQAILRTGRSGLIILDRAPKGQLTAYMAKSAGNTIVCVNNSSNEIVYDTLEVTAGGHPYRLRLSDGSEVIVNVASKLRYPEKFRKGTSQLELIEGEAYFHILHNANAPLNIKAKDQTITDIGTEFNINIYKDEPDGRTTLVEGEVKVNSKTLKRGDQAIVKGQKLTISTANLTQVTAWKEGFFRFNGEHIDVVMRELARWYNIEVKYEGELTDVGFYIKISRAKPISEVLQALEGTNSVHFKIEGRRITVLRKV